MFHGILTDDGDGNGKLERRMSSSRIHLGAFWKPEAGRNPTVTTRRGAKQLLQVIRSTCAKTGNLLVIQMMVLTMVLTVVAPVKMNFRLGIPMVVAPAKMNFRLGIPILVSPAKMPELGMTLKVISQAGATEQRLSNSGSRDMCYKGRDLGLKVR